jgi:Glycosyltransferase
MRVLQIITCLGDGGASKLLADIMLLCKQRGLDMDLLLLNRNPDPLYEKLEQHNITIYSLSKGSLKKRFNPFLIFKIIPFLKQYDIIHVHLFPPLYWVSIAKLLCRNNVKIIYTEHNSYNNRMGSRLGTIADKIMYRNYDKIISISEDVNEIIKAHTKLDESKYTVITNGIDLSLFTPKFRKNKEHAEIKTIIQVSLFNLQKDQKTLIKSLQYLPENIHVTFAGDGDTRKDCEQLAKSLNLTDRVRFLGNRNDVPELLSSADIVVQSSHWEGFGLAALEGMAMGKPVIATDVPGLRQTVKSAGILFPVGDAKALADEITKLVSDEEYYNKVAKKSLEQAKLFDFNVMVDKYIEVYNEILQH